jgi:hypothetical protein
MCLEWEDKKKALVKRTLGRERNREPVSILWYILEREGGLNWLGQCSTAS